MTSLKDPSSEYGDTSPELDVLTGPPAAPAVATEVARDVTEPPPASEPMPEPVADTTVAKTTPPPPIDTGELPSPSSETPETLDELATAPKITEEAPAEAPQPVATADEPPPEPSVVEPVTPEPVEPAIVDAGIDGVDPTAKPGPLVAIRRIGCMGAFASLEHRLTRVSQLSGLRS